MDTNDIRLPNMSDREQNCTESKEINAHTESAAEHIEKNVNEDVLERFEIQSEESKKNKSEGQERNENDEESMKVQKEKIETQKEVVEILNVEFLTSGRTVDLKSEGNEKVVDNNLYMTKKEMEYGEGQHSKEVTNNVKHVMEQHNSDNILETIDLNKCVDNTQTSHMEGKQNDSAVNVVEVLANTTPSGLSLLSQYDSDNDDTSDTDSVIEVPSSSIRDYRNQVVEISSDSDSDDCNDSDVEYLDELRKTIEKRIEVVDDDDDAEECDDNENNMGKKKHKPKLKVKGEMLLEDLPPIQDLQITVPEDECTEFGKVHSIVDQLVLVSALPNSILLDLETVIFLEKGQKVLGEVFDVLGQVADPLYCVRFNSNQQIKDKNITVGDVVYVAPKTQYTQYVILSNLIKLKGSDASWENDIEPPPRFLDYSDDEEEQLARRQLRNKDRPMENDDPSKRPRTGSEGDISSSSRLHQSERHRIRSTEARGGSNNNAYNSIQRCNDPYQNQRPPNYYRSSWHSNYYPQHFLSPPTANYRMTQTYNQPYPPQIPMFGVPSAPYPPPGEYGAPHMSHYAPPQLSNSFNMRHPLQHGPPPPHGHHQQQYTSNSFNMRHSIQHVPPPPHGHHQQQFTSSPPPPGCQ